MKFAAAISPSCGCQTTNSALAAAGKARASTKVDLCTMFVTNERLTKRTSPISNDGMKAWRRRFVRDRARASKKQV